MAARAVLFVAMCLAALQVSLAKEDLDMGDPQTALWAIAREEAIVRDNQLESAQIVKAAADNATAICNELVAAQIKAWQDPIDAEAAKARAAGADVSTCLHLWTQNTQNRNAKEAVAFCVVAARAQYDARVKKLQVVADGMLDLIVKAQDDIKTCAGRSNEFLQYTCRQTKLVWDVLTAQDNKSKKAVPVYFEVYDHARDAIPADAATCTSAALQRNDWSAQNVIKQAVKCMEKHIADLTTAAPTTSGDVSTTMA